MVELYCFGVCIYIAIQNYIDLVVVKIFKLNVVVLQNLNSTHYFSELHVILLSFILIIDVED